MKFARHWLVRIALVVAVIVTGGCNTSAVKPSKADAPVKFLALNDHGTETAKTLDEAMDFELDDFYFEPTFIHAKSGSRLRLVVHNDGEERHSFEMESLGVSVIMSPGTKKRIVNVVVHEPGKYVYWCKFHHRNGMQGAIIVDPDPSASS